MIPQNFNEKDFIYRPVSKEEKMAFRNEFYELLRDFALTINMSSKIEANDVVISYICKRVDQRKDYYLYYHSSPDRIMHMSHEKEMGLWAYWVSKYKPLRFKDKTDDQRFFLQNGCTLSDAFAAYIIISIVCENNNSRAIYFTDKKVLELYYDFSHRDFSKEAIISRIEDLTA